MGARDFHCRQAALPRARHGALLTVPGISGLCLLMCFAGWACGDGDETASKEPRTAVGLFEAVRFKPGRTIESRMKAAGLLAKHPDGEGWIALLLTDPSVFLGIGRERPDLLAEQLQRLNRPVVAVLLEGLPASAGKPVLWAVTYALDDKGHGLYPVRRRIGWFTYALGEAFTEPIREIARATLVRCLGVDHEYDKAAWRRAILKTDAHQRPRKKGAATRPAQEDRPGAGGPAQGPPVLAA